MDARVLMPPEFSLVVSPRPLPPLDRLLPLEDSIKVCARRALAPHSRYLPFSGAVRAHSLPLLPFLQLTDVSHGNVRCFCLCLKKIFVFWCDSRTILKC